MNELKFNSQVCTTKEQSQRLLKSGLKPETADMSITTMPVDYDGIKYLLTPYSKVNNPKAFGVIPAWSLHRLMEIGNIENAGFANIKNAYDTCVSLIASYIKFGLLNKKYLKSNESK